MFTAPLFRDRYRCREAISSGTVLLVLVLLPFFLLLFLGEKKGNTKWHGMTLRPMRLQPVFQWTHAWHSFLWTLSQDSIDSLQGKRIFPLERINKESATASDQFNTWISAWLPGILPSKHPVDPTNPTSSEVLSAPGRLLGGRPSPDDLPAAPHRRLGALRAPSAAGLRGSSPATPRQADQSVVSQTQQSIKQKQ